MRRALLLPVLFACCVSAYAVTVSLQQVAAASTIAANVVPHVLHPKKFARTLKTELARLKRKKATKGGAHGST